MTSLREMSRSVCVRIARVKSCDFVPHYTVYFDAKRCYENDEFDSFVNIFNLHAPGPSKLITFTALIHHRARTNRLIQWRRTLYPVRALGFCEHFRDRVWFFVLSSSLAAESYASFVTTLKLSIYFG
jgi:hypothetical protein